VDPVVYQPQIWNPFAMKTPLRWLLILALIASRASSVESPDPVLVSGLQSFQLNGIQAGLNVWYSSQPEVAFAMKEKLIPLTQAMGNVIDTEVVAIQPLSRRVTRYYVAVYFTHGPVWLRLERYASDREAIYLPLKASLDPDRILPGYLTEFQF
jgi:hypothetical protein